MRAKSDASVLLSRRDLLRSTVTGVVALAVADGLPAGLPVTASLERVYAAPASLSPRSSTTPTVVQQWTEAVLAAIRTTHPGPPMAARALALLHTAIYDAWACYHPAALGTRLGGLVRRPRAEHTGANTTEAITYAAFHTLVDLFPTEAALFTDVLVRLGGSPAALTIDTTTPRGIGTLVARTLMSCCHGDGSNQLGDVHEGAYSDYTGYVPVNDPDHIVDPNRWQPLSVPDGHGSYIVQKYIGPHWGLVTPFALTSGTQFRPPPPARYPSPAYREQAREILRFSAHLTDTRKVIAEYWADGPGTELPPGHWCRIAQFVSQRDGHDLDADVQLHFIVSNALLDAGIACWEAKRAYDSVRPITAIHYLFARKRVAAWGGPYKGTTMIDGGAWQPYQAPTVVTPAFPEHVSGHSTFSAAAAEVLKRFTGSDRFGASHMAPAGSSLFEPHAVPATDVRLSWPTFSAAADQAGLSRRFGGIHFRHGDLAGRALGRRVGAAVWERAQRYIMGTP